MIKRTSNLADIRHGLQRSQLEVAECFATHGSHLKRVEFKARGRQGLRRRRFSHIRLVLREIDFPLKIAQAKSLNQKERWRKKQQIAEEDYKKAKAEKDEMEELKTKLAEKKAKEDAKK